MKKIFNKIFFAILIILFVGINGLLISAIAYNDNLDKKNSVELEKINIEEAKSIALEVVSGTIEEVEIENENGRLIYVVEVKSDDFEYEVKIDFYGEVINVEKDEGEEIVSEDLETNGMITESEAVEIALGRIDGEVVKVESEREGGRILYEVVVNSDGEIVEIEIDSVTGEILEVE